MTPPVSGVELEAVRRIDWRFLLPDPAMGPVHWHGPADPAIERALALAFVPAGPTTTHLAVAADRDQARALVRALPVGGQAVIELAPAGLASRRRAFRAGRAEASDSDVFARTYWPQPTQSTARLFVPIDRAVAAPVATARKVGRRTAAAHVAAARWTQRLGVLEQMIPAPVVTAVRAGPGVDPRPAPARLAGLGEDAQVLLLTPRYDTSRHVVALVYEGFSAAAVVKIGRLAGEEAALLHERDLLDVLQRRGSIGTPRTTDVTQLAGHTALVQTVVGGRGLNPRTVRGEHRAVVPAVAGWLATVPAVGHTGPDWFDREIGEPLRRLADTFPERRHQVERTLVAVDDLRGARMPTVVEHGDLREGNVLWDGRAVSVVDWETGVEAGLVGADLAFFCSYVAMCRDRSDDPAGARRAFDAAFVDDGWGSRLVETELSRRAVSTDLLPAVLVATFARYALRFADRRPGAWPATFETELWDQALRRLDRLARR